MEFRPFRVRLTTTFRGVTERSGVLIRGTGPDGADAWGEFSPFPDYSPEQRGRWWAAAMEAATGDLPAPVREAVATAAIIPELGPEAAAELASAYGCRTAKVKVGGPRGGDPDPASTLKADAARVEAVAAALGPGGKVRLDANGAWSVDAALAAIAVLERAARAGGIDGLEYVEQPCVSIGELAAVRKATDVPIAADESIRLTGDIDAVVRADAADILVLKPSPLGGARAVIEYANRYGMPVVVSSAMESSVGLAAALAAACALPGGGIGDAYAHGLGTGTLLATDTVDQTLVPIAGHLRPTHLRVTA